MGPQLKVACIGEAMVELALDAGRPECAHVGFAGDTLNTAIYLKRSAPELDVSYVTRLGRDAFSAQMTDFIENEQIRTDAISFSDTRTPGLYAITTDAAGERSFAYWRGQSAARDLFSCEDGMSFAALEGFDILYFSAITLAILSPQVRAGLADWLVTYRRQTGGRVVFDSNFRPALWSDGQQARDTISEFWRLTDIALPSIDDEMAIFADQDEAGVLARLAGYGIKAGALKRGDQGPVSLSDEAAGGPFRAATKVVDTTAAGDSFNGGYLGAILTGASQKSALVAGHDLAAKVVGVKGAILPRNAKP